MSVRGLFAAFAVLSGVGASLIVPMTSTAQLAETMTATSIQGQVATMQKSNLLTPGRKARQLAGKANANRLWEEQAVQGSHQKQPPHGVDSANVVAFDEKSPVRGKSYFSEGVVISDGLMHGKRTVLVLKVQAANRFQVLGFRLHDPNQAQIPENTPVRVTGVYASKFRDPNTGSLLHGFDGAVFESGLLASAQPQPESQPTQEAEKPTFATLMKGWEFRGTVQAEGKATGVFVNGEQVRYAQSGTELDEGVRVSSVKNGVARVVVEGRRLDVTPW